MAAKRPTYNHTRGDGFYNPCPECAPLQTKVEQAEVWRARREEEAEAEADKHILAAPQWPVTYVCACNRRLVLERDEAAERVVCECGYILFAKARLVRVIEVPRLEVVPQAIDIAATLHVLPDDTILIHECDETRIHGFWIRGDALKARADKDASDLTRLRAHDPDWVRAALGEDVTPSG